LKQFLDDNFLLQSKTAQQLFHEFAKDMPIIDYHNHLSPEQIANDHQFDNITQVWLYGDHYKWRAMRANGINEYFITGGASDWEKFEKWAETIPFTMRNPLYHWAHLELQRYFGIFDLLSPLTAKKIWDECNAKLQTKSYSVQGLLAKMQVKVLCTTDDPLDGLEFHQTLKNSECITRVLPAFRPDKAMNSDDLISLNEYIDKLADLSNQNINDYDSYLSALKGRHDFFAANGASVSDHGLEHIYSENYTELEVRHIFKKIRHKEPLYDKENLQFKSAMLFQFALWNHEKGWVQQFHLGALRNNNDRLFKSIGPDAGFDSIGDSLQAQALARFLNKLDSQNKLAKTILYNLNPAHNEVMAAMIGNYQDGTVAGKLQWGSAWWFLDQKDGMTRQINALSNMGLLSRFIGMLTDSRSFLSYPRHEYFRRLLCDIFGNDVESGELPFEKEWLGKLIQDICYNNAKEYFKF
jgi:glucuronate isomerase